MQKTKTKVYIDGIEYSLSGRESQEYLHQVAQLVDKRLRQTKIQCDTLNGTLIAVLTAVNIADELLKEKMINQSLENQIREQHNGISSLPSNRKRTFQTIKY